MAVKNKTINNPVTGQTISFLQTAKDTGGALLEMESCFAPHSKEPVAHFHPFQQEVFTVLEGCICVRMNNQVATYYKDDVITMPANTIHSMWNDSNITARVNWKVQPALETEVFFETAMGLAADGKVNQNGMPSLFQTALLVKRFRNEFRLAKPPAIIQKIVFNILSPMARLAGYKAVYPQYFDELEFFEPQGHKGH
jgi:quercetin dioxygenase-like cupin family protein